MITEEAKNFHTGQEYIFYQQIDGDFYGKLPFREIMTLGRGNIILLISSTVGFETKRRPKAEIPHTRVPDYLPADFDSKLNFKNS